MVCASGLILAMAALLAAPQDPQDEPPPKPVVEIPGVRPKEPEPEFPGSDGLTFRTLFLRPRFELTTREFDVGMFSGTLNFGDVAGFNRTSAALEGRLDVGPWMFSATGLQQRRRSVLAEEATFEQHAFSAGSIVQGYAFFGTIEAFHRFELAGGPAKSFQVSLLIGLNWSKMFMRLSDDGREASEGFSALWPLPAAGVEARLSLSETLSITLSARGTRFRFSNPFQLDGGGSQDIRYLYGRFDAGFKWDLGGSFSVSAGYTGIDAFINAASAEDTDTADLKAGGLYSGLTVRF